MWEIILFIALRILMWGFLRGHYREIILNGDTFEEACEARPKWMVYALVELGPIFVTCLPVQWAALLGVVIGWLFIRTFLGMMGERRPKFYGGIRYPKFGRVDIKLLNLVINGWNWVISSFKRKGV